MEAELQEVKVKLEKLETFMMELASWTNFPLQQMQHLYLVTYDSHDDCLRQGEEEEEQHADEKRLEETGSRKEGDDNLSRSSTTSSSSSTSSTASEEAVDVDVDDNSGFLINIQDVTVEIPVEQTDAVIGSVFSHEKIPVSSMLECVYEEDADGQKDDTRPSISEVESGTKDADDGMQEDVTNFPTIVLSPDNRIASTSNSLEDVSNCGGPSKKKRQSGKNSGRSIGAALEERKGPKGRKYSNKSKIAQKGYSKQSRKSLKARIQQTLPVANIPGEEPDNPVYEVTIGGEKMYYCSVDGCGKLFSSTKNVKRHLVYHRNDRPFQCGFVGCDKAFKTNDHLTTHQLVHTREAMFSCDQCGDSFTRKFNLERHRNLRHAKNNGKKK